LRPDVNHQGAYAGSIDLPRDVLERRLAQAGARAATVAVNGAEAAIASAVGAKETDAPKKGKNILAWYAKYILADASNWCFATHGTKMTLDESLRGL